MSQHASTAPRVDRRDRVVDHDILGPLRQMSVWTREHDGLTGLFGFVVALVIYAVAVA